MKSKHGQNRPTPPKSIRWLRFNSNWPMSRQRRLVQLMASGMPLREIDEEIGCSSRVRDSVLKRMGYEINKDFARPLDWRGAPERIIRTMWATSATLEEIADALAAVMPRRPASCTIRDRAGKMGLPPINSTRHCDIGTPEPDDMPGDDDGCMIDGISLPSLACMTSAPCVDFEPRDYAFGAALARALS